LHLILFSALLINTSIVLGLGEKSAVHQISLQAEKRVKVSHFAHIILWAHTAGHQYELCSLE
jgi:hypothetical protein